MTEQTDDRENHAQRGEERLLTRGVVALLIAIFLLPTIVGACVYAYAREHPVVPGLEGCRFVRARTPQIACYSDRIAALVRSDGLRKTLQHVDAVALAQPTLAADCHLAWHQVGERRGERDAKAARDPATVDARSVCQEGYLHGYTIGYLSGDSIDAAAVDQLFVSQCTAAAQAKTGRAGAPQYDTRSVLNCVHSFGHVHARRAGTVAKATRACQDARYGDLPLAGEEGFVGAYEHQCLYGMYMEIGLMDLKRGSKVEDNCKRAPGGNAAKKACYAYISARVGALRGGLEPGARACHRIAPRGEYREACVRTFAVALQSNEPCDYFPDQVERSLCRKHVGAEALS